MGEGGHAVFNSRACDHISLHFIRHIFPILADFLGENMLQALTLAWLAVCPPSHALVLLKSRPLALHDSCLGSQCLKMQ